MDFEASLKSNSLVGTPIDLDRPNACEERCSTNQQPLMDPGRVLPDWSQFSPADSLNRILDKDYGITDQQKKRILDALRSDAKAVKAEDQEEWVDGEWEFFYDKCMELDMDPDFCVEDVYEDECGSAQFFSQLAKTGCLCWVLLLCRFVFLFVLCWARKLLISGTFCLFLFDCRMSGLCSQTGLLRLVICCLVCFRDVLGCWVCCLLFGSRVSHANVVLFCYGSHYSGPGLLYGLSLVSGFGGLFAVHIYLYGLTVFSYKTLSWQLIFLVWVYYQLHPGVLSIFWVFEMVGAAILCSFLVRIQFCHVQFKFKLGGGESNSWISFGLFWFWVRLFIALLEGPAVGYLIMFFEEALVFTLLYLGRKFLFQFCTYLAQIGWGVDACSNRPRLIVRDVCGLEYLYVVHLWAYILAQFWLRLGLLSSCFCCVILLSWSRPILLKFWRRPSLQMVSFLGLAHHCRYARATLWKAHPMGALLCNCLAHCSRFLVVPCISVKLEKDIMPTRSLYFSRHSMVFGFDGTQSLFWVSKSYGGVCLSKKYM
ncbi:hypothetical protein Hanom_Chr11g00990231 [Helianthus anomalus]